EWLLRPERVGEPVLYGLLVAAELFNLVQAAGFWWTCRRGRDRPDPPRWRGAPPRVDVLVPVYNEPLDVVGPTISAAVRMVGARHTVWVLDDLGRIDLRRLAESNGARYVRRGGNAGAKAGNLNHALGVTDAPFIALFDCDHVPDRQFLVRTLGWLETDRTVAFVQTPQYYANAGTNRIAAASWSQQSLFFGGIARGKDAIGAMFCCGTNVVFRRSALEAVGGFPEGSLTEDFALSVRLHERRYRSVYVNEVLAQGLGPEDMTSYVSQQQRWARGCVSAIPAAIVATLPWRVRLQYLLSAMFFLSGWTFAVYMALPAVRIFVGIQPLAGATASQFLVHFAPYFCLSLAAVAVAGAGSYCFDAFALMVASAWVQIVSTILVVLRRTGRFVVTAKHGKKGAQPRAALPSLLAIGALVGAIAFAFSGRLSASTLNNVAFAALHVSVLAVGSWAALVGSRRVRRRGKASPGDVHQVAGRGSEPVVPTMCDPAAGGRGALWTTSAPPRGEEVVDAGGRS
ncbi:MAG: glycosyltransferase family 2 protein, partial [Solirubrobacteraceae bacterium]